MTDIVYDDTKYVYESWVVCGKNAIAMKSWETVDIQACATIQAWEYDDRQLLSIGEIMPQRIHSATSARKTVPPGWELRWL